MGINNCEECDEDDPMFVGMLGTTEGKSCGTEALTARKRTILEFFPHEYLLLQTEVFAEYHPKLHAILARVLVNDLDMKIAHIASYCEVVLDDVYTLEDRTKLCVILTQKLMLKREEEVPQVIRS